MNSGIGRARATATSTKLCSVVVFVVAAPPDAFFVSSLGCAVEPLIHGPDAVDPARIGGIGVIDDAVFEHEGTYARPLACVRSRICAGHGCEYILPFGAVVTGWRGLLTHVVVFDGAFALLLFGERDVEVRV